jgi:hypothetical protein
MFPVPQAREELPNKAWVIGIVIGGKAKAYPLNGLPTDSPIKDQVGHKRIVLRSLYYLACKSALAGHAHKVKNCSLKTKLSKSNQINLTLS